MRQHGVWTAVVVVCFLGCKDPVPPAPDRGDARWLEGGADRPGRDLATRDHAIRDVVTDRAFDVAPVAGLWARFGSLGFTERVGGQLVSPLEAGTLGKVVRFVRTRINWKNVQQDGANPSAFVWKNFVDGPIDALWTNNPSVKVMPSIRLLLPAFANGGAPHTDGIGRWPSDLTATAGAQGHSATFYTFLYRMLEHLATTHIGDDPSRPKRITALGMLAIENEMNAAGAWRRETSDGTCPAGACREMTYYARVLKTAQLAVEQASAAFGFSGVGVTSGGITTQAMHWLVLERYVSKGMNPKAAAFYAAWRGGVPPVSGPSLAAAVKAIFTDHGGYQDLSDASCEAARSAAYALTQDPKLVDNAQHQGAEQVRAFRAAQQLITDHALFSTPGLHANFHEYGPAETLPETIALAKNQASAGLAINEFGAELKLHSTDFEEGAQLMIKKHAFILMDAAVGPAIWYAHAGIDNHTGRLVQNEDGTDLPVQPPRQVFEGLMTWLQSSPVTGRLDLSSSDGSRRHFRFLFESGSPRRVEIAWLAAGAPAWSFTPDSGACCSCYDSKANAVGCQAMALTSAPVIAVCACSP